MRIANYFENILEKQKQLGYQMVKFLQGPADKRLIRQIEAQLNLTFNKELLELYGFANGLSVDYISSKEDLELFPLYQFLSVSNAAQYYQVYQSLEESFHNLEKNYYPGIKLFPVFANGSGDVYWVDLNENTTAYGKIYWTNTLPTDPDYLFESLTSMFKTIWECYRDGIISLNNDGILSCDYTKWGFYSEKNSPELRYWKIYNNS